MAAGAPRVLCVDDDDDSRELCALVLRMAGFATAEACGATAALGVVRGERVDVAVVDLGMPDMDGWELTRRLRSEPSGRDVPILILTAHVFPADRARAEEAGCNAFLTKPVDSDVLVATVAALVRAPRRESHVGPGVHKTAARPQEPRWQLRAPR